MQNNNFSVEEAMRLASSPAGQALLQQLQRAHGAELAQARKMAESGDYEAVRAAVASLTASGEIRDLLERSLGNAHG